MQSTPSRFDTSCIESIDSQSSTASSRSELSNTQPPQGEAHTKDRQRIEASNEQTADLAKAIRVLCVDDNDLVAEALQIKLQLSGGFEWLGRLPSADSLVEVATRLRPDVVLLDIDMPGKSPFVALVELREGCPDTRVLMISGHVRQELIDRAFECGAWGYISKNDGTDVIVQGVRDVARGEFAMGPEIEVVEESAFGES